MKKIALMGMGAMGSRMALRLLDGGFSVTVYNRTEARCAPVMERGARVADTPRAAAEGADVVLSMLTDDVAAKAVWLDAEVGAMRGLQPGAVALEASTLSAEVAQELESKFQKREQAWLHTPVVGSLPQVEAGQLVCLVGGNAEILERVRGVLESFSGRIVHVGKQGQQAASAKLAINTLLAVQVAALGEIVVGLRRAELTDVSISDLLAPLGVMSPVMQNALKQVLAEDFRPLFPVRLVAKDLAYSHKLLETRKVEAPVTQAALKSFEAAAREGLGDLNLSAIVKHSAG